MNQPTNQHPLHVWRRATSRLLEDRSVELINNFDYGNHLYLQTNDNSSLAIVNVKLVGAEIYKLQAAAMKIALKGKNKLGFVDGTCVKQESSVVLSHQWEMYDVIVLGWILGSLS
ncbi:ribonuclease H-like domain-containing protein [Tanacetum coccineum]